MKPAFSVIFLTTLIGVGQGLFVALYCAEISGWVPDDNIRFFVNGSLLSLSFLVGGLIASFFHLGRPERAWRAATMWKTSWLSREVIILPATMLAILSYAAAHQFGYVASGQSMLSLGIGAVGVVMVFVLFLCTAMIYACIKFLQEWASPLTVVNFIFLGLASGFVLSAAFAKFYSTDAVHPLSVVALILVAMALVFKTCSVIRNQRIKPKSSTQTAIGIRHNRIRQQSVGFMGGSFNTRAFFHGNPKTVVKSALASSLVLGLVIPALLIMIAMQYPVFWIYGLAFAVQYIGLLIERWHFFVQARHPQNLYYQSAD